ncbi:SGNH/GDSL hydrolase family protein [Rhizobium brockwellii]|uniref:SGNH/GDSL hydrolase family protein n=1 Tax=Rhizobium brockwellii TaxID=3019932 RepID=A0ABU3YJ16_9HYPH|nr:SGNH/GDSL hydrolase family protein [Rhizobium brockwellii]MDV4178826.1 SGNH/GDSL hydrolase family protein [Rhizobium brockwellii]MDV4185824.1 SGNH/GDSL hydrolase family protein [Rhizobium brockwellii]
MMNAISLALTSPMLSGGGGAGGDPDRYMFFATRNRMPSGSIVTAASGTNYVCTKIVVNTPQYKTRTFRFHLSGFASTEGGNAPQETVVTGTIGTPGNSVVADAMFIRAAGVFYQCTFAGLNTVTVADQTNGAWTDELTIPDVDPESEIEIWLFYHTAVGEKIWPVYRIQKHRGERVWGAGDLATLLVFKDTPLTDSTTALDTNYATVTQPQYYGPDFMVAKGDWDGRAIVLGLVDSIGEARQQFSAAADARGNLGWFRRWLDKDGGIGRIPHLMIGMPGNGSVRELTGTGAAIATRRWAVLDEITAFNNNKKPFTVIANQMGQNDTAATYTQFFNTNYRSLITRLRARYPGVKIVALPPLGRTVSTRTVTLTSVGTVVTATIASGINGLTTGQTVSISGAAQTEYNGNVVITVTGPNSFTYNFAGSATSPATGTITANDLYLRASYQGFSANNTWPADGTDASGKWRLRADILAKTSACCDDAIDTYAAWVSAERDGVWPGMLELSSTMVTVQSGTDGVAAYTTIEVADAGIFGPEQEISTYAGARLSTTSIGSISGNTITISIPRSTVLPVGSIVRPSVTPDGVHPYGAVIDRVVGGIPQSEKLKFNP